MTFRLCSALSKVIQHSQSSQIKRSSTNKCSSRFRNRNSKKKCRRTKLHLRTICSDDFSAFSIYQLQTWLNQKKKMISETI